jgi:hypothetical protein
MAGFQFTEDGWAHRKELLREAEDRIERERFEPPDMSNLSETAKKLLRRMVSADEQRVEVTPKNRGAFREMADARPGCGSQPANSRSHQERCRRETRADTSEPRVYPILQIFIQCVEGEAMDLLVRDEDALVSPVEPIPETCVGEVLVPADNQ